jgi:hypothetical protein
MMRTLTVIGIGMACVGMLVCAGCDSGVRPEAANREAVKVMAEKNREGGLPLLPWCRTGTKIVCARVVSVVREYDDSGAKHGMGEFMHIVFDTEENARITYASAVGDKQTRYLSGWIEKDMVVALVLQAKASDAGDYDVIAIMPLTQSVATPIGYSGPAKVNGRKR